MEDLGGLLEDFSRTFGCFFGLRLCSNMIRTQSQRDMMRMISSCQLHRDDPMTHLRRGQSTIATRALGSATSRLMLGSCTDRFLSRRCHDAVVHHRYIQEFIQAIKFHPPNYSKCNSSSIPADEARCFDRFFSNVLVAILEFCGQ